MKLLILTGVEIPADKSLEDARPFFDALGNHFCELLVSHGFTGSGAKFEVGSHITVELGEYIGVAVLLPKLGHDGAENVQFCLHPKISMEGLRTLINRVASGEEITGAPTLTALIQEIVIVQNP